MDSPTTKPIKEPLWTADYVFASLSIHFFFLAYATLLTILPVYVVKERGGEEWELGVAVGVFSLSSLLIRPFAGRWIARWGGKPVLIAGALLYAAGYLSYMGTFALLALLAVRLFHGVGQAMGPVACNTMVANLVPESRRAEGFGYYGNSPTLAHTYGPALGFWVITAYGPNPAFLLGGVICLASALAAIPISASRTNPPRGEARSAARMPLINRSALFPSSVFLAVTASMGAIAAFLPLLTDEKGLGNPGLFYVVNSVVSMPARIVAGSIADRASRSAIIVPGLAMTAASMVMLSLASNYAVYLSSAALLGIAFAFTHTGLMSMTVDRVRPAERSSALATFQIAWDIGGSGGAVLPGFLARVASISFAFGVVGLFSAFALVGFIIGNAMSPTPQPRKAPATSAGDGS